MNNAALISNGLPIDNNPHSMWFSTHRSKVHPPLAGLVHLTNYLVLSALDLVWSTLAEFGSASPYSIMSYGSGEWAPTSWLHVLTRNDPPV